MWARGIPFDETMEKGSGKLPWLQRKLCLVDLHSSQGFSHLEQNKTVCLALSETPSSLC